MKHKMTKPVSGQSLSVFRKPGFLPAGMVERSGTYALYQPKVTHHMIHEAKIQAGHYGYNHDVSLEWFQGKFYAAWNAHGKTHVEGDAGQVNVLATSRDFEKWSLPVEFLREESQNPVHCPDGVMWQPNLLNLDNRKLLCFWCLCDPVEKSAPLEGSGTYMSVLDPEKGDQWINYKIVDRHAIRGRKTIGFPSQNPFLCRSGRILLPVTFIDSSVQSGDETRNYHYNVCMYSDDEGQSWDFSSPITQIDDHFAQWEPFFFEQSDGHLRAFMRNFTTGTPPGMSWQLTSTGRGARKGEKLEFDPDAHISYIETANTRCQVFRSGRKRFCMLHHDLFLHHGVGQWKWNPHRDYHSRLNISLFFSRTGRDDFVAALPVSRRNVVSTYPQGIEHEGRIYAAYTTGAGDQCRSIEGVCVDAAPDDNRYYIWPREKDDVKMKVEYHDDGHRIVTRANPDEKSGQVELIDCDRVTSLFFRDRISAGVEIPPFDYDKGQVMGVRFRTKVLNLQEKGMLVFCSFGDRIPVRIALPSNRRDRLYAYTHDQWRPAGYFTGQDWENIEVIFGQSHFSVKPGDQKATVFKNPVLCPNPRLYFGDGYESMYLPTNIGSEFVVDISSIETFVHQEELPEVEL